MEQWKDIPGYEGLYQVSDYGNVWNVKKNRYHTLEKLPSGYIRTRLNSGSHSKTFYVHRLVAEAFVPNPNNYPEVNHIDEQKWHNFVNNLEWVTRLQNVHHGTGRSRARQRIIETRRRIPVVRMSLSGEVIKEYPSASAASEDGFTSSGYICSACKGKTKSAYGYLWKYKKDMG